MRVCSHNNNALLFIIAVLQTLVKNVNLLEMILTQFATKSSTCTPTKL